MYVVGTAGHVDHGKSSLVEALTGIDPDRWAEEKERGLTIDLGFAWLTTPSGREIGIVDVPGHERFIKNMLAGAGGISICLFVVAANEGWMPQSTEHLAVLDLLGVSRGVVVVTKTDLVEEDELDLVIADIEDELLGTSLQGTPIVACSVKQERGLEDVIHHLEAVLDGTPEAVNASRPRLWVDRSFTIPGAGTVVTGTLTGGNLRIAQEIAVASTERRAHIRSIQTHRRTVEEAAPGTRVALNLAQLPRDAVTRGDAIVEPGRWRPTRVFDALIRVTADRTSGRHVGVSGRGAHLLYCGSAETEARISVRERDALGPDETGHARIHTSAALPLQRGDRFVLRDTGRALTIGGGIVLDPLPTARGRRKPSPEALEQLESASGEDALALLLEQEGEIQTEDAFLRTGTRAAPGAIELGERLVSMKRLGHLRVQVIEATRRWHSERPLERGIPRETLRAETDLGPREFDALLSHVEELADEGPLVRLHTFRVQLDPEEARQRDRVFETLEAAGFRPPLTTQLGVPTALLQALESSGELVKIGDFHLSAARARRARTLVRSAIEQRGPLSVAEIRDLLDTTRKYAVPLCEWLDRTGATIRRGDLRVLGPNSSY